MSQSREEDRALALKGTSSRDAELFHFNELSKLEQLPNQVLRDIFIHSNNINLLYTSSHIRKRLDSDVLRHRLASDTLFGPTQEDRLDQPVEVAKPRALLLNTRFVDAEYLFRCRARLHAHQAEKVLKPFLDNACVPADRREEALRDLRAGLEVWRQEADPGLIPSGFGLLFLEHRRGAPGRPVCHLRLQHGDQAIAIYLPTTASDCELDSLVIVHWKRSPNPSSAQGPGQWTQCGGDGITRTGLVPQVGAGHPPVYLRSGTARASPSASTCGRWRRAIRS